MKVTTVRFSEDLWATVAAEAEIAGVSASQFVREAALARAAAAAGSRGEMPFPSLRRTADELQIATANSNDDAIQAALAVLSRALASPLRTDSNALRAQSREAKPTAEALAARRVPLT